MTVTQFYTWIDKFDIIHQEGKAKKDKICGGYILRMFKGLAVLLVVLSELDKCRSTDVLFDIWYNASHLTSRNVAPNALTGGSVNKFMFFTYFIVKCASFPVLRACACLQIAHKNKKKSTTDDVITSVL